MTIDSGSLFVCRATALKCPVRSKVLLSCVGFFCSLGLLGLMGPGSPAPTENAAVESHAAVSESQELAWIKVTHEHMDTRLPERGGKQLDQRRRHPTGAPAYD